MNSYIVFYESEFPKEIPNIVDIIEKSDNESAIYEFCLRCKTGNYPTKRKDLQGKSCGCEENLNRAFLVKSGVLAYCEEQRTYQGHGDKKDQIFCEENI